MNNGGYKLPHTALMLHLELVTMTRALVVLVTLGVLQALWGSAFSLPGGAHATAPQTVDEVTEPDNNEYCHSCVKIDNFCYNHTYLFQLNAPFGEYPVVKKMGIMKFDNVLYYTFEPKLNDLEYSKVAYVSLDTPTYFGVISGWHMHSYNFDAFDINDNELKVYLGGSDGIWDINPFNHFPTRFAEKKQHITNIVTKDYMYFTKQDTPGIVNIVNGSNIHILKDKIVNNFVLTVDFNVVYLSDTGLYISFNSKNQTEPVRLSTERFIRGLTVDALGTVYAWHLDGIYKVVLGRVPSEATLKRVSGIVPDAMAFDRGNNIVYAMGKNLYTLTKVLTSNCNTA